MDGKSIDKKYKATINKMVSATIGLLLPVSDQPIINDWSRWFAISRLSPICSPSFNFTGGVGGGKKTKLECAK